MLNLFRQSQPSWRTLAVLALFAAATLPPGPAIAQTPQEAPALTSSEVVEMIQSGGLVLLIRHERTEVPSRGDDYSRPPEECRSQRNLSLAGIAGAQETGVSLRILEVPIGRVISSPMCRAAETARSMFGVEYETDTRLMHHDPGEGAERDLDAAEAELRGLLAELAPALDDSNVALVSHGGNIFRVSGLRVTEGEIAVLRLSEDGTVEALGQITGSALGFFARSKLADEAAAR